MSELLDLASQAVDLARQAGATHAECTLSEGEEFSVNVRLGEIETIKQAGSRGVGLRILVGPCTGASYTSDFTADGIRKLVHSAMELAAVTTPDHFAGLPDPEDLGLVPGDLNLFSSAIEDLTPDMRISLAKRAEAAALSFDPRIHNSDGASFDSYQGRRVFANSLGFSGEYATSYCSLGCVPVARNENQQMERDYWYTSARSAAKLEDPESVGRKAAERAVRRLGPVKVPTQKVPIVFDPRVARSLVGDLFDAIEGRSIYRQASFLLGRLGQLVASPATTLIDDGTIPGLFGTRPFDAEGVPTRRTPVIQNGVLQNYLLNSYSARKLNSRTTGNASRGITGNAGIGPGNLYLEAGPRSPEDLLSHAHTGFYVTELIGSGVDTATGTFSCGATGLWIENGVLTYAVSEVTVAGTLQEMLASLEPANDLEFRGAIAAPTLLVGEMTVGGR